MITPALNIHYVIICPTYMDYASSNKKEFSKFVINQISPNDIQYLLDPMVSPPR